MPVPTTRPAVLAATAVALLSALVASAVVLALQLANVSSLPRALFLQSPVSFPYYRRLTGLAVLRFVLGLLILVVGVGLVTAIGTRSASRHRGAVAVGLSAWLGAVLAGCAASTLSSLTELARGYPFDRLDQLLLSAFSGGAHWGVTSGWLVGLAAAIVFGLTNRERGPQPRPASGPAAAGAPGPATAR
jgi:hypothetical protein